MATLKNCGKRRLGIAGRQSIILDPNKIVTVSDEELKQLRANNRTLSRWIESGLIEVDGESAPAPAEEPKGEKESKGSELPDGLTGEGFEIHHEGGGWYSAYMNGFKVTDDNVRKGEAEALAEEYE